MDVLVGKQGNQPFPLTDSTISRQHAIVHVDNLTGQIILKDNNSTNGTWILMKDGTFKRLTGEVRVNPDTTIRLGATYICTIKKIIEKPEKTADISNLRFCYDTYTENKMTLDVKSSNIMMIRIVAMSLGSLMGLFLSSFLIPEEFKGDQTVETVVRALGTVLCLILGLLCANIMNKNITRQKRENEDYFKQNYCCPKCGYHFGNKVYTNLLAEGRCPNNSCKCKFTGK